MNIHYFKPRTLFFLFILLTTFFGELPSNYTDQRTRIVHVVTYLKVGGVEAQLYDLIKNLQSTGKYEHHIVYFQHNRTVMVEKMKSLGIQVHHVKGLVPGPNLGPLMYYEFKKLIKRLRPDIIHSGLWTADVASRLVGKSLNIPVVCDIHEDCNHLSGFRNWSDARTVHLASRIVAVSKVAKASFEQCVLSRMSFKDQQRFRQGDLEVVYNGVDVDAVVKQGLQDKLTRRDVGLNDGDFVFGYVCNFNSNKGCDVLIKAFAQLCRRRGVQPLRRVDGIGKCTPKLCLIGDGKLLKELKKLAATSGVSDKVHFMGYRSDVHRFYPLFDCYMMASYYEAISVALLDALCFSLPVIATQRLGFHDVIEQAKNGLLVPPGDPESMSYAMEHLFTHQDVATQMGQINRILVDQKFSVKSKAERYDQLFQQVIRDYKKR